MRSRWRSFGRALLAGALLGALAVVAAPEVAGANVVFPPDPSWVTNVSIGNSRDDGFKVKALARAAATNTIYVGGSFTQIAPDNKAFIPSGGQGGTPNQAGIDQPYLFAVDGTTGAARPSFRPRLNGPVEALAVGPGNRVYVGGSFTMVNGVPLNGFAILDGTTGALAPGVTQRSLVKDGGPGSAWAILIHGTKVYVGGAFTSIPGCNTAIAGNCNRGQLARFDISTPATNLDAWKVAIQGAKVQALAIDPNNPAYVYAGGQFNGAGGVPGTQHLAAIRQSDGVVVSSWQPNLQSPPPGPGGVVRPPEVRGLVARAGRVYAGIGGGGGRFYVMNGAQAGNAGYLRTINTDGDVQTVEITPAGDRVFVGGHFTRLNNISPNERCQLFAIDTGAFNVQAVPNLSNGGHYGPFAIVATSANDTWWGGQLTVFANGYVAEGAASPAACGAGDQRNKAGTTANGYVGGIAHLRSSPGFADTAPPSAPTITSISPGIFQGVTLTWTRASDNLGVSAYYVRATGPGLAEQNMVVGTQWGTDLGMSIPPSRLSPNAVYQFRVCAVDLGDNERCGAPVSFRTAAAAPNVPGGTLRGYGEFFPVNPARIYDTRVGTGLPGQGQPLGPGTVRTVQVAGLAGVPADAMMVALNVTVTQPTASGYLTVYPFGAARPTASNLNFAPGQTVPNLVNARLGSGGRINLFNFAGSAHVIVDVVGWYGSQSTTARGGRLVTQSPQRVLDTRPGLRIGPYGKVGTFQEITVKVAPAGATGVVLNLTGTEPTASTFITAWPANEPRPGSSNLNLAPGQTRPNLVMVKVSPQGTIKLYNHTGATHLVVDVVGVFTPNGNNSQAGRVLPLAAPMRVLDTRITPGAHGPTTTRAYDLRAIDDATNANVGGLVMNVTATEATTSTYLTVYPAGEGVPLASNLNVRPGENIPNLVVNKLGAGDNVGLFNFQGQVHYLFDVAALVLS